MWPFRSRPLPVVTNEAYSRWLRAWQPPWAWFLGRPDVEQEAMALLGDEHSQRLAVHVGWAVRDPGAAEAGLDVATGDARGEETLAIRIAQDLAKRLLGRKWAAQAPAPSTIPPRAESMSVPDPDRPTGLQERKAADLRTLFGRPPDVPVSAAHAGAKPGYVPPIHPPKAGIE